MSRAPDRAAIAPSALLIDVGNSRIKWALWRDGRLGPMHAAIYEGWTSDDFARRLFGDRASRPDRVVIASVAGVHIDRRIIAAARPVMQRATRGAQRARATPELVVTSRRAAGVVTRYADPWRLGVDRFLGVIAAHRIARGRDACVINAGTAVTLDLVDGRGVHHGGAILPGPQLMIESLLRQTAGIARRASGPAPMRTSGALSPRSLRRRVLEEPFARNTAAAIEQGAWYAVAGAVETAISASRRQLGRTPLVILTGGAAPPLQPLIRAKSIEVPDLVLQGLALLAGLRL